MIWNESIKLGVIGTYNSGKTVFITSLLNHLLHHQSEKFQLKGSAKTKIKKAEFLDSDSSYNKFPYEAHRDALVREGRWPHKTLEASYQKIALNLNRGFQKYCEVTLFDFPGEALADASIAALDYKAWSKTVLQHIQDYQSEQSAAKEYLELSHNFKMSDEQLLISNFKLYLARRRKSYRPLIQPSSFILSESSGLIESQMNLEDMIKNRYLGFKDREFIPLSESMMDKEPELCKKIEKNYQEYRNKKVLPLFKELAECDSLLILNDLPTMLNSGSDMCNDTIEMVQSCLNFCQPGKSTFESLYLMSQLPHLYRQSTELIKQIPLLGTISRYVLGDKSILEPVTSTIDQWLGVKKIKRIVIAASKCDLVHENDRDHLLSLLKELFQSTTNSYTGIDLHWTNLSAAVATRSSAEYHALVGEPEFQKSEGEKIVKVSELPPKWPNQWKTGEYSFPDFKPKRFPGLKVQTPEHYNLDKVFNALMGWES